MGSTAVQLFLFKIWGYTNKVVLNGHCCTFYKTDLYLLPSYSWQNIQHLLKSCQEHEPLPALFALC